MPIRPKGSRRIAGSRERKARLQALLDTRDVEGICRWVANEPHAQRTLFSALFALDDLHRWRAIEALGQIAGQVAATDPERVRDWIRRILWNMMEESGGLMWHGPEAIGEMLAQAPGLIPEYLGPLGSYRVEEPFEAGTYIALARLAGVAPSAVAVLAEALMPGLENADPRIRAHAALALGRMDHGPALAAIAALAKDSAPVTVYDFDTGALVDTTVGALAAAMSG